MTQKSTVTRKKPGPVPRHGGYSLLTTGRLPERRRYIAPYLTEVREGLVHDLGESEASLSTAQRVLIDRAVTFLGVVRLIEEHAREYGLLDQRGNVKGGIGSRQYLAFNRHIKDCLALLGLKRIEQREPSFAEIIKAFDERKADQGGEGKAEETR